MTVHLPYMHAASMKFPEVDHPPMWVLCLQDKPRGISQKYPTKFLLQAINGTWLAKVSGKMADITLAASSKDISSSCDGSLSNNEVEITEDEDEEPAVTSLLQKLKAPKKSEL